MNTPEINKQINTVHYDADPRLVMLKQEMDRLEAEGVNYHLEYKVDRGDYVLTWEWRSSGETRFDPALMEWFLARHIASEVRESCPCRGGPN